jgi:hypothetical protein
VRVRVIDGADYAANYDSDEGEDGHYGDPDDAPFATVPGLHFLSDDRSIRGFRELTMGPRHSSLVPPTAAAPAPFGRPGARPSRPSSRPTLYPS